MVGFKNHTTVIFSMIHIASYLSQNIVHHESKDTGNNGSRI